MEQENPFWDNEESGGSVVTDVVIETTVELADTYVEDDDSDEIPVPPVTIMVEGDSVKGAEDSNSSIEGGAGFQPLASTLLKRKSGKNFLDKGTVLSLLLQSKSTIKVVPFGPKAGKNFLLEDEKNFYKGRRKLGRNIFQVDEYNKWDNLSLKKHHYIYRNGRFKYVDYIGGQYQLYQSSPPGERSVRRVMARQPMFNEILVMRKLYGSIPGTVRRRISYIEKFPQGVIPKQESVILVEYCEPADLDTAKSLKLSEGDDLLIGKDDASNTAELEDDGEEIETEIHNYPDMLNLEPSMLEEVQESRVKRGGDNSGVFFDKNEVIDILINSETTLEEIPQGLKENEYFIVKNEENHQRELEGKRRIYVDDCGVWKNVSMKKHFYTKVDDCYYYVEHTDGSYRLSNSQLRAKCDALEESDVVCLCKVYGCLRRDEDYKRRICWIDKFSQDMEPRQKNIALVEYVGKYPKMLFPHGNQKNPNAAPYVRTPQSVMKKMKEEVAHKSVKEVLAEFPDMDISQRQRKQLHNLRYRSTMRIGPGTAKNEIHNEEMRELYGLVQSHAFAQQVTFEKYKSPMVVAYTAQQLNSWKYHCQEKSGLDRVLGVDRTFNIGPVCLTILTYPHPNLLSRKTAKQAIMMGPILFHVDKSWCTYSLLFNHISRCLSSVENADVDGISVACKTEEEKPIMEALNRSFPNSTITLCGEHMKLDLKHFLTAELVLNENVAESIAKEIFGELMMCGDEYEFDTKLVNFQTEYDATIPQFSNYFRKLGENIRHSLWRPTVERNPLLQWSPETCQALTNLIEYCKTWGKISLPSLILHLHGIVTLQEQEEIRAIHNEGCYVLAPHARNYGIEKAEWRKKTSKQKARLAENMRKMKPGASRIAASSTRSKPKQEFSSWETDQQYY